MKLYSFPSAKLTLLKNKFSEYRIITENIIEGRLKAGSKLSAYKEPDCKEIFFLKSGLLLKEDENIEIKPNFYFVVDSYVNLKVLEDSDIIIFRTKDIELGDFEWMRVLSDIADNVEKNDDGTFSHCARLRNYAVAVASELEDMTPERLAILEAASYLHDVGKVNIPLEILNKPGKLTNEERKIMETHVEHGKNILMNTNSEKLQEAAKIVYQHHENIHGTGYPQGLKEEDIIPEALILSMVDVYDALATKRPYKEPIPKNEIFDYLYKNFPKKYVDILKRIVEKES